MVVEEDALHIMVNNLGNKMPVTASEVIWNKNENRIYIQMKNGLIIRTSPLSREYAQKTMAEIQIKPPILYRLLHKEQFVELRCSNYDWITKMEV